MTASSVRVDRVVERQTVSGDVVDDRFGLDLDERDAPELRGVEGPSPDFEELLRHRPTLSNICSIVNA